MNREAWFVGGVALTLAAIAFWAALANHDRCYDLPKIRWLVQRFGRRAARLFYLMLGVLLAVLAMGICGGL